MNIGFRAATGKYIARMDGDDIALPERLAVQVAFMENNDDISICGSKVVYIDEKGKEKYTEDNFAQSVDQIKADFLFFCFVRHPTVVLRKSSMYEFDLFYNEDMVVAEDYELWSRAVRHVKFAKVPETLLKYRWHLSSASHTRADQSRINYNNIVRGNLKALEIDAPDEDILYLSRITCEETFKNSQTVKKLLNSYYGLIIEKNKALQVYDESCLVETLNRRMYWKKHKNRRLVVVFLKSIAKATMKGVIFSSAIYLELNGFSAVLKRMFC